MNSFSLTYENFQCVDLAAADTTRVEKLAREYRLTAYDAAYLEIAQRLHIPLATLDKELIGAARHAGVGLLVD